MKPVYFSLGWVFFFLGALGVVLPVLPTTPFMLLALWAFSKSSDRFHQWLYHHKVFGPPLQQWARYRVIPLPMKIMAIVVMALSLLYIFIYVEAYFWLKLAAAALITYGVFFISTKPSRPPKI